MRNSKNSLRTAGAVLACLLMIGGAAAPASAEESNSVAAGWGVLSAFSSLLYAPLKVVYATGGLVIGGIAFGLSAGDSDVWNAVVTPAVRGDYVVTPGNLRGEDTLEFIGRAPDQSGSVYSDASY